MDQIERLAVALRALDFTAHPATGLDLSAAGRAVVFFAWDSPGLISWISLDVEPLDDGRLVVSGWWPGMGLTHSEPMSGPALRRRLVRTVRRMIKHAALGRPPEDVCEALVAGWMY